MACTGEAPGIVLSSVVLSYWLVFKLRWDFFIRVLEERRRAKGDLECSFYNAERRKKPVTCTPKV